MKPFPPPSLPSTSTPSPESFGGDLLTSLSSYNLNNITADSPLLPKPSHSPSPPQPSQPQFDFSNIQNKITEPHYETKAISHPFDYLFEPIHYQANNKLSQYKPLYIMPKHIRNTLFFRHSKIKQIRKMNFSKIFFISEELKHEANTLLQSGDYIKALEKYNLVYSLFKWIEIGNKQKEKLIFTSPTSIHANPIVIDDIVYKTSKYNKKDKHESFTYKNSLVFTLKGMSLCYINMRMFKEAMHCLNEALEYATNENKIDLYFRRGQTKIFNSYSNVNDVTEGIEDLIKAFEWNDNKGNDVIQENIMYGKKILEIKKEENNMKIKSNIYIYNVFRANTIV